MKNNLCEDLAYEPVQFQAQEVTEFIVSQVLRSKIVEAWQASPNTLKIFFKNGQMFEIEVKYYQSYFKVD